MQNMATYQNPVFDRYFADPFVWRSGGLYHAVGTGPEEATGGAGPPGTASVFPLLVSRDLVHWQARGKALVRPDAALGDSFWAPEVAEHEGRFYLYYSVGFGDRLHQLRVAVAERPDGPYLDHGRLTDPERCAFAIDPHPFRDVDGRYYLFHARDFLDGDRPGTSLVVHELENMTSLAAEGRTVLRAGRDWQRFMANRPMYQDVYDWHTLEGPCVLRHEGRYYCFYSGGRWETETYGVDYAVADHVLGPYSDEGNERGPRVLRTIPGRVLGPGHNSIVLGPDGVTPFIVYHAWDPAQTARRLCIDRLEFGPEGPRCHGPTFTPQPLP